MSHEVLEAHYLDATNFTDWTVAAPPANSAAWEHFPALIGLTENPSQKSDGAQRHNRRGQSTPVNPTAKEGSVNLQCMLHGGTLAWDGASGDTDPVAAFLQTWISQYMGAAPTTSAGTTVKTANTGTGTVGAPLTLTDGSTISAGEFIQAGSERRMVIQKVTADNCVLDRPLTVAANYTAGTAVYGCYTWAPALGEYHYLQMLLKKYEHTRLYVGGGVTSFQINNGAAGDGLRAVFAAMFDSFTEGQGYTDPSSFTDITSKFSANPLVAVGSPIAINSVETDCVDFACDFGVSKTWKRATAGTNGRSGMRNVAIKPSGEASTSAYSATIRGYYESKTKIPLFFDVPQGSTNIAKARNSLCIYVPNAQIEIANDDAQSNDQNGVKFSWQGHDPEAASQTAGLTSAIYLGLFGGRAT